MKPLLAAVLVVLATGIAHADPGDQAGLSKPFAGEAGSPFVGSWRAHGEAVTIEPNGDGTELAGRGQLIFKLGVVMQTDTGGPWLNAQGHVVSGFLERGAYVSVLLVDNGKGMQFSAGGGDQSFPFCRIVNGDSVNRADCGA
jgi:hypothetical protein